MIDIQLNGFEMLAKLGQGGMATVWKARQISLNRTVAIKILSSKFASDQSDIQRFQQEAQSAAKLKHPGIVQVYDANIEKGLYFFVMEFVDGYTCADWLIRKGHLDEKDILLIADCVSDALGYAWEREKMIHCDIKPDNIMIDEDGTVKVTDLGLSRTISTMSVDESDEILGTPAYMAPEQALGEAGLDCRTDMYSLGAMMYHLCTGKLLFEECPEEEVMERQVNDFAKNPRDLNPSLTRGFCRLIEVLMAKEQAGRPADWTEVRAAIAKVKKGLMPKLKLPDGIESTVMKSVTDDDIASNMHAVAARAGSHSGEERSQNKMPIIVIIAAVLVACIGCAIWVIKGRSGRKPPPAVATGEQRPGEVSQLPGESQSDMRARQLYYSASSWEQKNPSAIDQSIGLYREVVQSAGGTKYAERAEKDITRLTAAKREKALEQVLAALKSRTDEDVRANRYSQAISAYENYEGDFADETRGVRIARAAELKQLQERWEQSEKQRIEDQRKLRFESLLDQIAGSAFKGDFKGAASLANKAVESGEFKGLDSGLQDLFHLLFEASEIEQSIVNTFIQEQGQLVQVELLSGKKQLMINDVRDGMVFASNVMNVRGATASVPANFKIQDISMAERLKRMGSDAQPHVALVKGVMACSSRSYDHAQRLFATTPQLLSSRLLSLIKQGQKDVKKDSLKEQVGLMLNQSGINTGAEYDKSRWIEAVQAAQLSNDALNKLKQNALSFQTASEGDEAYAEVQGVVAAVLSLEPKNGGGAAQEAPLPAALPQVKIPDNIAGLVGNSDAALERLLADNPSLGSEDVSLRKDDEGRVVGVKIRDNDLANIAALAAFRDMKFLEIKSDWKGPAPLSDLSPLAGLPLERVDIDGSAVVSLAPLKDLPIRELRICRAEVRDITPLRGMKLEVVELSGTKVFDFSVLSLMPVKSFSANRSQIKQLSFMRDWQLESLEVSDTAVYDLSVVARMPLKRLLIANTQVRMMDCFNTCPLEELNISGTAIRDLNALKNHSDTLKRLVLERVPVKNFDVLRQLNLESVSLEGTEFSDIKLISHMKLKELNLSGTKVTSLDGLDAGELEVLRIEKSGISSISCLKDSGIKRLECKGSGVRNFAPIYGSGITHITVDDAGDKSAIFRELPKLEYVNGNWWNRE